MNINTSITKYIVLASMTLVLVFGAVAIAPAPAHACIKALGFLDPICVITGKADLPTLPGLPGLNTNTNTAPQTVNNSYTNTNSNNTNSNINSPGASVGGSQPIAYNTTPVYNYNYPVYNSPAPYNPLQVSCYPMPLSARSGDTVSWVTSAYGGNGSYYFTWTGTDGLSGYGSSISKTYYSTGYKSASVTVTSGGQTVSKNCDGTVNVYGDSYNYPSYPSYPSYPTTYYSPLTVSCTANNNTYSSYNNSLTWNAYAAGGSGYYTYSWSGTDGLYGSGQSAYFNYTNPGVKYATVTVYSNGQSITQACSSATVGGSYYVQPIPVNTNNSGLDIACYSNPRTVTVNQPATWTTEVTGGVGPYTYTWSGSDDLSGNTSSVSKYYSTAGNKSAIISVRSADGRSETRACSTSVTVRSASTGGTTVQPAPAPTQTDNGGLSAAALFSLKNVPWGWVAILIILVLFGTVIYLLFNKPKI